MQPTPLTKNENAWVYRLGKYSIKYQEDRKDGISTALTSMKFKYLSPDNSTDDNDSP